MTDPGLHVLYVDDESVLIFLMTRYLRKLGYRVTGKTNPSEALAVFRANPADVDVVVSDLSMPGMSGFELVQAIRELRADIPIVLTSGHVKPSDLAAARELGVADLILKANAVDELGDALHRVLHRGDAS